VLASAIIQELSAPKIAPHRRERIVRLRHARPVPARTGSDPVYRARRCPCGGHGDWLGEEWVQRRRGSAPARPGRLFPRPPLHLLLLYTPGPHPEHGATPSSVHHSRNADTPCRHAMCMRQPFPRELAAATARHRAPVAGARPREWPSIRHLAPRGALPIRVWSVLSLLGMGLLPVGRTKNGYSVSRHRESSSSEFRAPQTSNETKRSLALQSCSAPTAWRRSPLTITAQLRCGGHDARPAYGGGEKGRARPALFRAAPNVVRPGVPCCGWPT